MCALHAIATDFAVERNSQVEIVDFTHKAVLCRGLLTNLCVSVTPRAKKVLCGINFDAVSISLTQRREGAEILDRRRCPQK